MKRIALVSALLGAIIFAFAGTGMAASSPKLTGSGGSPGGTAQVGGPIPFSVNVTAQGTAPNANGAFTFTRADGTFGGSVDCYVQSGNTAWASGRITSADGTFNGQVGQGFVVGVRDNGQGAGDPADKIQVDIQPYSATLCSTYPSGPSGYFPYDVTTGNFQIH